MNMGESLWNCTIDGSVASWSLPAGVGFKPPSAAAFKRRGGERLGKRRSIERQVSIEKMSESEPLMTHRKVYKTLSKLEAPSTSRTSQTATCLPVWRQSVYKRHELDTGFSTEHGNLTFDVKGNDKWREAMRKNTDAKGRGGAVRSSDEAFVMNVERRGGVIQLIMFVNLRE